MQRAGFKFGIFERLSAVLVAVTLLPLLIIGALAHSYIKHREEKNADEKLQLISAQLTGQVDDWTRLNLDLQRTVSKLPEMRSPGSAQGAASLSILVSAEPWISNAHVLDLAGNDLVRSDGKPLQRFADRRYFREVLSGAPYGAEVIFSRTLHKPALSMAVPLLDDARNTVAVLAVASELDSIAKSVENLRFGATGFAFLMQGDGTLIASPRVKIGEELPDFSHHPAYRAYKAGQPNPISYTDNGRAIIAHVAQTEAGWINVVQEDFDESRAAVRQADRLVLLMLLPAAVLALAAAFLLSRNFTAPIRSLTAVADQISLGELEHDIVQIRRGDEIGDLARAIERLAKSMRLAMARLQKR
ncbi:MAG: hypothetical protein JWR16_1476 [Nevskia sp.]|nr:hypothetical protein [Nevskia sp.]